MKEMNAPFGNIIKTVRQPLTGWLRVIIISFSMPSPGCRSLVTNILQLFLFYLFIYQFETIEYEY